MGSVLFAIFGCLLVVSQTFAGKEELTAAIRSCKDGDPTQRDIEMILKPLIPESEEEKCQQACILKHFNVIKDGKYDAEEAMEMAKKMYEGNPQKINSAKISIQKCSEEVSEKEDECDLAEEIMRCGAKYVKEMNNH